MAKIMEEEEDFEEEDGICILLGLWWETLLGDR